MKLTYPLKPKVRCILLAIEENDDEICGQEVANLSGVNVNSIYVVLRDMERAGLLSSRVEKIPGERNRPKRFYRLIQGGKNVLKIQRAFEKISKEVCGDTV